MKSDNVTPIDPVIDQPTFDDYKTRLLKLIPTEIIAAFVAVDSLLKGNMEQLQTKNLYDISVWIVFGILLILTPVYLKKFTSVLSKSQLTLSTIAFVIWVMTIGGPFFILWGNLTFILGSILLILYTLVVPIFYK